MEGALFLVVAFVALEVDGSEGTVAAVVAVSTAAAATFLPLVAGLARGLGGAVLKWLPAAFAAAVGLVFVPA